MILASFGFSDGATLALALFTAVLAWSTRRLAREAGNETRANWRPVLAIEASYTMGGSSPAVGLHEGTLSVGVNNIGRGPAIEVTAFLLTDEATALGGVRPLRPTLQSDVLAPDGRLILTWPSFDAPQPPMDAENVFAALDGQISYGDVSYARYTTEFQIGFQAADRVTVLNQRFRSPAAPTFRQRAIRVRWTARIAIARLRRWWRAHKLRPR